MSSSTQPDTSGAPNLSTGHSMVPIPGPRKSGRGAQPPGNDATTEHTAARHLVEGEATPVDRPAGGRKRQKTTISLSRSAFERLKAVAAARGVTPGSIIDEACSAERLASLDLGALLAAADFANRRRGQVVEPPPRPDPAVAAAFGVALRRWRTSTGRDQAALAAEIRSSATKVCRVELGRGAFLLATMRALAGLGFRAGEWMR